MNKMKNNNITLFRFAIMALAFFIFSFAGYWIGANTTVIVPVFNCEYASGGTTRGACIVLIDFNKNMGANFNRFMFSVVGCIISVLLIGRLWCGYTCPVGFFQDIITWIRQKLKITQINIPQEAKPIITLAKWYLVFYILFYDLCKVCPIQFFTVPATGFTSGTSSTAYMWAVVMCVAIILSDRAFCRVCPLGAMMGVVNRISGARLKKCGSACTHCRACLEVCPVDIQEVYEDRENEDITHPDCVYCMKCIEVCPEKDALYFELFGIKLLKSKRMVKEK
ncbi:MAG: hypothetical protein ATN35_02375 [Epulopiscium sp. Nele67-Bin004]|nr:MAG: hypothetical protein ATN35_02375 [Epulopiscium sp. Nele67-Bin004]